MADRVGVVREGRLELVDTVEALRARAAQRVEVTFAAPPPAGAFAGVAGVRELERHGAVVLMALEGSADALVKRLADFEVLAIDSHEADLEDVFLGPLPGRRPPVRRSVLDRAPESCAAASAWWSLGLVGHGRAADLRVPDRPRRQRLLGPHRELPGGAQEALRRSGAPSSTTPRRPGYLGTELFSLIVPLLLIIAAVATGARAIAGEEERGTLDLLMSLPVTRRRVTAEKLAAMAARGDRPRAGAAGRAVDRGAGGRHDRPARPPGRGGAPGRCCWRSASGRSPCSSARPPAAAASAIGHRGGPRRGRLPRQLARGAGHPSWSRSSALTPFYHYTSPDPLRDGVSWPHLGALLLVVVVASAAALVAVDRRDLGA